MWVTVAAWLIVAALALLVIVLYRNIEVCKYRLALLDKMRQAMDLDALEGFDTDAQWRFDAFDAVSYQRMVWQIWRYLDDFYPDRRFTLPQRRATSGEPA